MYFPTLKSDIIKTKQYIQNICQTVLDNLVRNQMELLSLFCHLFWREINTNSIKLNHFIITVFILQLAKNKG